MRLSRKPISRGAIEIPGFGRVEIASKPAHDLDVDDAEGNFTVGKLQAGYTRYLSKFRGVQPGIGASVSAGLLPGTLEPVYGGRVNVGFGLFLTLRPTRHVM